jgi:hypothetical protein
MRGVYLLLALLAAPLLCSSKDARKGGASTASTSTPSAVSSPSHTHSHHSHSPPRSAAASPASPSTSSDDKKKDDLGEDIKKGDAIAPSPNFYKNYNFESFFVKVRYVLISLALVLRASRRQEAVHASKASAGRSRTRGDAARV